MVAVIRFVFLVAMRDRLFTGLVGLLLLTFGISLFLGNGAILEQREAGAVYAAGTTRIVLVLGLAIFVAFQTQRLFESREIEAILSRALSRPQFVIAYWAGFVFAAFFLIVPVSGFLFLLYGFSSATAVWLLSLFLECLIVLAFVLFAALTFERATTTIFVTLAFYAFTRLIGFFLGIKDATPDGGANKFINPMIDALGYVLPRVDLMTQTSWLIYGFRAEDFVFTTLLQSVVFIAFALAASMYDLQRKQF